MLTGKQASLGTVRESRIVSSFSHIDDLISIKILKSNILLVAVIVEKFDTL